MNPLRALLRMFSADSAGDPCLLDHVPVSGAPDWRETKLKAAAERHGKPFRCAADGLPRERIESGTPVVVGEAAPKKRPAAALEFVRRKG